MVCDFGLEHLRCPRVLFVLFLLAFSLRRKKFVSAVGLGASSRIVITAGNFFFLTAPPLLARVLFCVRLLDLIKSLRRRLVDEHLGACFGGGGQALASVVGVVVARVTSAGAVSTGLT